MGKAEGKEKDSSYILCHLFSQEDSSLWLTTKKSTVCLYMLINTKRSLICLFVNVLTFISMNCYCSFYRQGWCKCMGVFMQVEARGQSRRAFLQVPSPCLFRHSLSFDLELWHSARLAGQQAPGDYLPLLTQCWNYQLSTTSSRPSFLSSFLSLYLCVSWGLNSCSLG